MKKNLFIFVFLLLGLVSSTPFEQILHVGCDGSVTALPKFLLGMNIKITQFRNILDTALDVLQERAKCVCPGSTEDDFRLHFDPVAALLNGVQQQREPANQCLMTELPKNLYNFEILKIDTLPNTCTTTTWKNNGTCFMQHSFPSLDMNLQLGIFKCTNKTLPGLSLTCSGSACANFAKPCNQDNDCGDKLTCFQLDEGEEDASDPDSIPNNLFSILQEIGIYGTDDASPGCYQSTRGSGSKTSENDILTNILSYISSHFYGKTGIFSNLQICGPAELFEIASDDLATTYLQESEINNCIFGPEPNSLKYYEAFNKLSKNTGTLTWKHGLKALQTICPHYDDENCRKYYGDEEMMEIECEVIDMFYGGDKSEYWKDINPYPDSQLEELSFTYNESDSDLAFVLSLLNDDEQINNWGSIEKLWQKLYQAQWLVSSYGNPDPVFHLLELTTKYLSTFYENSTLAQRSSYTQNQLAPITTAIFKGAWIESTFTPLSCSSVTPWPYSYLEINFLEALLSRVRKFDTDLDSKISSTEYSRGTTPNGWSFIDNYLLSFVAFSLGGSQFPITLSDALAIVSLKFRRFFDLWDTNGDGFLSHNERLTEAMNLHSIVTVQILPKALTNWTASTSFSEFSDRLESAVISLVNRNTNEQGQYYYNPNTTPRAIEEIIAYNAKDFQPRPSSFIPSLHRIFADIAESLDTNNDLILSHQEFKVFFDGYSSSIFDSTKYFVDIVLTGLRAKVPDLTFEEFDENLSIFDKSTQTLRIHVNLPNLSSWDGKIAGSLVSTQSPRIPPNTPSDGNIIKFTCDQNIAIGPNGAGLTFGNPFHEFIVYILELFKDIVDCRSPPPTQNMATFLTRFGPWSPFFWLYIIDDKSITFPISDQSDWVRTFFNPGETHDARFSNLPSSCNFYQFLSTGTCEFYFDGLKTLFLADITLKFSTKTCGISSQFSSYAIDCIGKDCHIFSGLTACDTNSQCGTLLCQNVVDFLDRTITAFDTEDIEDEEEEVDEDQLTPEKLKDYMEQIDLIKLVFGKSVNNTNLCSPLDPIDQFIGKMKEETCFGPTKWRSDAQKMILAAFGKPNQATTTSRFKFCFPDTQSLTQESIKTWIQSLVTVAYNDVKLGPAFRSTDTTPTISPTPTSSIPTCRCSGSCQSLNSISCKKCYESGGMVIPGTPNACFCPSNNQFLDPKIYLNYDSTINTNLPCSSPLPACSSCGLSCDSSCLSCFGTGPNRCLSCSGSDKVFVSSQDSTGVIVSGRCLDKCPLGHYRSPLGFCQSSNCTALNDCSNNGQCIHSEFLNTGYCKCNTGYNGESCQTLTTCNPGCVNGNCVFNQYFRAGRCTCNSGWEGDSCSTIISDFQPKSGTELGGDRIQVFLGSGFTSGDSVNCKFGEVVVAGIVTGDGLAYCVLPPSTSTRLMVPFSVQRNSDTYVLAKTQFNYIPSNSLIPRSEAQRDSLLWKIGTTRTITWDKTKECLASDSTVTVTLTPWEWDQFSSTPSDPSLGSSITLGTPTSNSGSVDVTLNIPSFSFSLNSKTLYILSLKFSQCSINSYVIPIPDTSSPNYETVCDAWINSDTNLDNTFSQSLPSCPNSLFAFDPMFTVNPDCNRGNLKAKGPNCYLNQGAIECQSTNFFKGNNGGGRKCCYDNQGSLIDNAQNGGRTMRYFIGQNFEIQLIKNFLADVFPYLTCCKLASSKCTNFIERRPIAPTPWIPPTTGGGFGDPHFVTLDGKFWTFNGLGEYVLIETIPSSLIQLTIQGRLSLPVEGANATSLTAIGIKDGIKDGSSTQLSCYLDSTNNDVIFFVGEDQIENPEVNDYYQTTDGVFIYAKEDKYTITLPTSSASIDVSPELGMLSVTFTLPNSLKNKVRGLLGTWSNSKDDDFTLRDGTIIPPTSTQQTLFNDFGKKYAVTEATSLFVYPDDEDFSDYNDATFVPSFAGPVFANPTIQAQAEAACQGANLDVDACLYDIAQTGDIRAAQSSLKSGSVFQSFSSISNQPPTVSGPSSLTVLLDQTVLVQFTTSDPDSDSTTLGLVSGPSAQGLDSLNKKYTFQVSDFMFLDKSISDLVVVTIDYHGSPSTLFTTKFSLGYSTCDSVDAVTREASLELSYNCLGDECSTKCGETVSRILNLSCKQSVSTELGEAFTSARAKCCGGDSTISCSDSMGQLGPGPIAGIVIGSVAGLVIIALAIFFIVRSNRKVEKDSKDLPSRMLERMSEDQEMHSVEFSRT